MGAYLVTPAIGSHFNMYFAKMGGVEPVPRSCKVVCPEHRDKTEANNSGK